MRRLPLLVLAGLAAATVAACGGNPPPAQPGPQANADSIAAAERARQDSIARAEADARAREEAERVARQRAADSLAAMGRTTEAVRTMLAAMIHFDFDKSNIRSGDAGTLDQKVGILQANPNLRIRISGHCDERGSDEYNLALGNRRATAAQQAYLVQFRGDVRTDLVGVQQQLVTVQELTGQSQQRLSELRARIEERAQQPVPALDTSAARAPVGPSGNPVGPGPAQMYDLSLQQYRRGSLGTARLGFREFLRVYPGDERAARAGPRAARCRWAARPARRQAPPPPGAGSRARARPAAAVPACARATRGAGWRSPARYTSGLGCPSRRRANVGHPAASRPKL